ncbi:MAG TPA: hypothetical protein VGQ93_12155 [Lysobacter sp.]|jgi:hypothetical protein|nr:hypothetical protein [Lysobacter sp.]
MALRSLKRQPVRDETTGDNLEKRWSPKVRLLFIVGACLGLWLLVALVAYIG